ncbi:MAG: trehalose-phosphatase [Rhizobiaceae bacterium]|nr:trehalose-phosphatase [Rhizobiaceae bacterium]
MEPPPLPADYGTMALFLDIDGTLIEHKPRPEDARADAPLVRLVAAASEALDGALALVTGRSLAMVDGLFAPHRFPAAGLYGLEHRLVLGAQATKADEPADLAAVADQLQSTFADVEGIYFERKGAVMAVHTRAAPAVFPEVKAAAERALERLSGRYRVLAGNAGLEFIPLDALKSAAISRLMQQPPFLGRRPFFFGDDTSDEVGFERVNELGGVSVRVGRRAAATRARYGARDVAEVLEWLKRLVSGAGKASA